MKSHYVNTIYRNRLRILAVILLVCLLGLMLRVVYIKLVSGGYLTELSDELHNRERTLESKRGDIVDRNGVVLATSGSICRVSVVHNQVENEEETARVLAEILGLTYEEVLEKVQKAHSAADYSKPGEHGAGAANPAGQFAGRDD